MIKDASTYEIMTPESVGLTASNLVMGKHSGRAAFRQKLEELGYKLGDNEFQDAFHRFKALADAKKHVYDEDIIALVADEVLRGHDGIQRSEEHTSELQSLMRISLAGFFLKKHKHETRETI